TWLLVNQYASFNSPAWFNVGIYEKPQCSACFINAVQDDMRSILNLCVTEGMLFKGGSGAGVNLSILRSKKITVFDGDIKKEYETFFSDMQNFFWSNNIKLAEFDIVDPEISTPIYNKMEIEIIRVEIREEVKNEQIKFKTVSEDDSDMGWREEKVIQKGENGTKKIEYEVVYYNDKEISRKIKNSEIIKEPTEKIIKKGTYVKIGKAHKGLASWYAQPSHLKSAFPSLTGYYAANPWLPKGSYVKVTNKNSGDSIIARINDRGPFGPGRIIDLDKTAFSAIASLGAGVVDVKMEEILN
ncbi:MAG: Lipoprotein A-like protein, partial [Candidatus Moranbacteria bacterium GW2011_GWD2_37_9]